MNRTIKTLLTIIAVAALSGSVLRSLSSALAARHRRRLILQCRVTETTPQFEMTVVVRRADIDQQNHVNNIVYLRWVQEVATAHWEAAAPATTRDAIGWVVLRHEIDYKTPASLGDEIVLRTWVGEATRITFERFTEIRKLTSDLRPLASGMA